MADEIESPPIGHISLHEAFIKYCEHIGQPTGPLLTKYDFSEFGLIVPFQNGQLEALVEVPERKEYVSISQSHWKSENIPEHLFLHPNIVPGPAGEFKEWIGHTPFVKKETFNRWLSNKKRWLSPMEFHAWTLGMLLVWIATRSRSYLDEFVKNGPHNAGILLALSVSGEPDGDIDQRVNLSHSQAIQKFADAVFEGAIRPTGTGEKHPEEITPDILNQFTMVTDNSGNEVISSTHGIYSNINVRRDKILAKWPIPRPRQVPSSAKFTFDDATNPKTDHKNQCLKNILSDLDDDPDQPPDGTMAEYLKDRANVEGATERDYKWGLKEARRLRKEAGEEDDTWSNPGTKVRKSHKND